MDSNTSFAAAGGISASAKDLSTWITMLLNKGSYQGKQILKPETVKALFAPSMAAEPTFAEAAPINSDSSFSFGMGWDNYNYNGLYIVEKAGAHDGFRTIITLIPEKQLGIVVLCNLNLTMLPEAIRAKFLELYAGPSQRNLQQEIRAQADKLSQLFEKEKPSQVIPQSHPLASYEGTFQNDLYGLFRVVAKDNKLTIEAGPDKWPGTLTHWSNDTFVLSWPLVNQGSQKATFTFGPNGNAIGFDTETLGKFQTKTLGS
jgi:hypothetical protein